MAMKPTPKCHFVSRLASGSLKIPIIETLTTLGAHNSMWRPLIEMKLKQSCSVHQELFNGMLHATCKQGNWGNFWLLVVRSQIANLTLGPTFGHNLYFKCPNGLFEPILDMYAPRPFPWYKELFNPIGFDPCNHSLKI